MPDIVNLVHYTDKQAFARFGADPEFRKIEPLRAGSVDLMTLEGYLRPGDPSPAGPPRRVYNVELATYRDGTGDAYRAYEERGEEVMRQYGYRVEYILDAETAPAGRLRPDLIKISSFPDEEAKAAFDADPAHAEVEQKLYPAATDHVVWLTGQAIS